MPWIPELFSEPALERIRTEVREAQSAIPYFDGLMSGELDALTGSFAGEPELHHPVRGRVKGRRAFERFVADTNAWINERAVEVEIVDRVITPSRGVEEVLVSLDAEAGRTEVPIAVVADRDDHARIRELRVYFSSWPLTGSHTGRPPLLQPDPQADALAGARGIVGEYQRALAAGDAETVVGTFEPDAFVREPAGGTHVHRGRDELHALYKLFFSNGGGIPLEHCALTDDGHACALEYNVVRWGRTELAPQAGIAVYVRGASGKLAAARIYDDADPPLAAEVS
jgi:hypothetical protein